MDEDDEDDEEEEEEEDDEDEEMAEVSHPFCCGRDTLALFAYSVSFNRRNLSMKSTHQSFSPAARVVFVSTTPPPRPLPRQVTSPERPMRTTRIPMKLKPKTTR